MLSWPASATLPAVAEITAIPLLKTGRSPGSSRLIPAFSYFNRRRVPVKPVDHPLCRFAAESGNAARISSAVVGDRDVPRPSSGETRHRAVAAVEAEDKFVEIVVEMVGPDAVMRALEPCIQVRDGSMDTWDGVSFAAGLFHRRLRESGSMKHRSRCHRVVMPAGGGIPRGGGCSNTRSRRCCTLGNETRRATASRPDSGCTRPRRVIGRRMRRGCEDSRLVFCRPCLNTISCGMLRQPDKHYSSYRPRIRLLSRGWAIPKTQGIGVGAVKCMPH
jgi:hypothetical protein